MEYLLALWRDRSYLYGTVVRFIVVKIEKCEGFLKEKILKLRF